MKIYLVGGAVRDQLLGIEPKDHDYVVVGATEQEMLDLGYKKVGVDFPVFLNDAGVEYALARTERKSGTGYHGFVVNADPSVTLDDDLRRRDLTINSMARDLETNELIDPFGGKQDLENRILRHTSSAFAEDPLRVLRVARFAARYHQFSVAPETIGLCQSLVDKHEMENITTERVWLEFEKALMEAAPSRFIITLWRCDAWFRLFPDINSGAGLHALSRAAADNLSFDERVASLFSETHLDKVDTCLTRFKVSAELVRLIHNVWKTRQVTVRVDPLKMLKTLDAYRRPDGFRQTCNVLRCLDHFQTADELCAAYDATANITFGSLSDQERALKGADVGKAIDAHRQKILRELTFVS